MLAIGQYVFVHGVEAYGYVLTLDNVRGKAVVMLLDGEDVEVPQSAVEGDQYVKPDNQNSSKGR